MKILQKDTDVLRKKAVAVPIEDIQKEETRKIIREMKEALSHENDGVGLAAPQIGYSKRIFIVAENIQEKNARRKHPGKEEKLPRKPAKTVFINPVITKLSKEKKIYEEGCLSVRPLYGKIERATRAKIKAYDEKGELFEIGGSGLLAEIFQHEVDHLDGVLFIDKATDIKEFKEEELTN